MSLPIIQSLWIGESLSINEQLCIKSFLHHGHEFHLYTYNDVKGIPAGVIIKDGNQILDQSKIFTYASGSYAGFADWFRWELLYLKGGIWADMDMICFKKIDFNFDILVGQEDEKRICPAILGFTPKHKFCLHMIDRCRKPNKIRYYDSFSEMKKKIKRKIKGQGFANSGWGEIGGPKGLTKTLKKFNLLNAAKSTEYFFPIHYSQWKSIYIDDISFNDKRFENTYCLHLWNEMTRHEEGFNKNDTFPENTLIERLKSKYL